MLLVKCIHDHSFLPAVSCVDSHALYEPQVPGDLRTAERWAALCGQEDLFDSDFGGDAMDAWVLAIAVGFPVPVHRAALVLQLEEAGVRIQQIRQ